MRLDIDPNKPLPFLSPADKSVTLEEQQANLSLLGKLNQIAGIDYPDDQMLRARIKSYELAFQMQQSIPETLQLDKETEETRTLYGLDQAHTKKFGEQCLAARRLVERGVRFVQVFHGGGGGGAWDAHSDIKNNHTKLSTQVDQPIAGLLKDLKQRGLLEETLVVFGTEFGRSPGAEGTGRDHHPQGFCAWLAGGGVNKGHAREVLGDRIAGFVSDCGKLVRDSQNRGLLMSQVKKRNRIEAELNRILLRGWAERGMDREIVRE